MYTLYKINNKWLLIENFDFKDKNIKYKKLKKRKYTIPCIISGYNRDNYYKIKIPVNYKSLIINKEYIVYYHLIINKSRFDKIFS